MTTDAVRDGQSRSQEEGLRAEAEALARVAGRLLAQAARLADRPHVPGWCVPTLRRQADSCRTAADDLRAAASSLGRHARRAGGGADGGPAGDGRAA